MKTEDAGGWCSSSVVQMGLQSKGVPCFSPFFTRLKAATDQSHRTELGEAQGCLITWHSKITLLCINMMPLWPAQNGLENTSARRAANESVVVLMREALLPLYTVNFMRKPLTWAGCSGNGCARPWAVFVPQTRTEPELFFVTPTGSKHPLTSLLLGSEMNLTCGFEILWSYQVGNELQSELRRWNSHGADPAHTESFHCFYTFQILFYVPDFCSPSCILCMFLPSVDSFALSKGNGRKEKIVAAFSIDFPLHSESHKLTFN